jgi:hypothetical protein
MTIVGRSKIDHPAFGADGGTALHAAIETIYTNIGDDLPGRFETASSIANSAVTTFDHNFGMAFSELKVLLYTGSHPNLTRVADPVAAGWVIAGTSGFDKTKIDVTAPSSGGPHTFALSITQGAFAEKLSDLPSFTSAQLISALSDETGSGSAVFGTLPSFTTGTLYLAQAEARFGDADSTNYVGFKAPGTVAANKIWILPAADGTTGQVLQTDGSLNLTWASVVSAASPTFSGVVTIPDGTEAAPGLVWASGTPNSGWYLIAADNPALSINGAKSWEISSTGAHKFGPVAGSSTAHITYGVNSAASASEDHVGIVHRFGADITPAISRTNATVKISRFTVPHYTTAEEDFLFVQAQSSSTQNLVRIGGASGSYNTATDLEFFTAATTTTLNGTTAGTVNSLGVWTIGPEVVNSDTGGQAHVISGGINAGGTGTGDQQRGIFLNANGYYSSYASNLRTRATGLTGAFIQLHARNDNTFDSISFYINQIADGPTTNADLIGYATAGGSWTFGSTAATTSAHDIRGTVGDYLSLFRNANASPRGIQINYTGAAPNGTANEFISCIDNGPTTRFTVRSNGGVVNFQANNVNLSDERLKNTLGESSPQLENLRKLEVTNFEYKDAPGILVTGLIAQQVESEMPELVTSAGTAVIDNQEITIKAVKTTDLWHKMLKAIQELADQNDAMKARLEALENA